MRTHAERRSGGREKFFRRGVRLFDADSVYLEETMQPSTVDPADAVTPAVDVAGAWHELGHRLRAYALRRVAPADADDIVQSVKVKLLEHRSGIGADSVRAWLFAVTRNAVAEYYRQRRPTVDLDAFTDIAEPESSDPAERTIGALSDCLEPMLDALAEGDADILRKVDLEGESQIALAATLGVPLSTVKSRVQRARTKLRATFDACCAIERGRGGAPISFERRAACTPQPCSSHPGGAAG
ncbi:MAG: polymerase sigma-70 factor, subfamily, partial [Acidobacteriota bacterium]|nr:polymerase sigma-70 factor, subfamily [Acidobacteriota bacterium]